MSSAPVETTRLFGTKSVSILKLRGLTGLLVPITVVLIWQLLKSSGAISYADLPAPSTIWSATFRLISSGALQSNVAHTLEATLGGWVLGCSAGLVLGVGLGLSDKAWEWSMASVDVMRSLPAITFVPIAVIILAQTIRMEIVIAAWVSIWPVVVSTIEGVRDVSPTHRDLALTLRLSRGQRIMKFSLPTAAPNIGIALRLSMAAALTLAIVAEIVGTPHGVGYALVEAQQSIHPAEMFSYILVIGLVGVLLNSLLSVLLSLVPGGMAGREQQP